MGLFDNWELPQLPNLALPQLPTLGEVAPLLGGLAGGLLAGGPGALAGAGMGLNYSSQDQANRQNREMAREQMDFQEMMSNTAHQREVADLRAAGLNPNLSAGGNGSSTPSGAAADMKAPQIQFPEIIQAQSMLNDQQRVQNETVRTGMDIVKGMSDVEINKLKKILIQKGLVKASNEETIEKGRQDVIDYFYKLWKNTQKRGGPLNSEEATNDEVLRQYKSMTGKTINLNSAGRR